MDVVVVLTQECRERVKPVRPSHGVFPADTLCLHSAICKLLFLGYVQSGFCHGVHVCVCVCTNWPHLLTRNFEGRVVDF